jgi:hypothetical protein
MSYGAVCLRKVRDPTGPGLFLWCTMSKGHKGMHVATKCGLLTRQRVFPATTFEKKNKVPVHGDVLAVWP